MRLLISKPDALGDQLIAAGPVQAMLLRHPDWRVVWHVRSGCEAIAAMLGGEVFTIDPEASPEVEAARLDACDGRLLFLPYPVSGYEGWSEAVRQRVEWWAAFLRATRWDAVLLGLVNRSWFGDFTASVAQAPIRIGFSAGPMRQPLVNEARALAGVDGPVFTAALPPSFERPEIEQFSDLLALLDTTATPGELQQPWQAPVRWEPAGREKRPRRFLIAAGVGGDARRAWGWLNFESVAVRLREQGATVAWIEGPGDAAFLEGLPEDASHPRIRFGATELRELAGVMADHDALLCGDTAYAHLAAAVGVPTVAVYGAGQGIRFHPAGGRVHVVQGSIACAGCQWHCLWDRLACVADLPVQAVWAAVEDLYESAASPRPVLLSLPAAPDPEGETAAVRRRLQHEVLALNADRYARLQIIQSLLLPASTPAASSQPGEPPPPQLSVIIPMGRPGRVDGTLTSLEALQPRPADWEILLVGREADSVARRHATLPITAISLEEREIPARARHRGAQVARGRWFLFIDDDVEPAPDTLERFQALLTALATAPENDRVGAIGFRLPGKTGSFFERLTDLSNFWAQQHGRAEDRDWLYTAAVFVRADAYRKIGGFDQALAIGEDVDLTRRMASAGYRLRYEPGLVALHDHRRSSLFAMWRYFWNNGSAPEPFLGSERGLAAFSVKAPWLRSWADFKMNRSYQRERGHRLGMHAPLVWLNYLIMETSMEWHYQRHLWRSGRFRLLTPRTSGEQRALAARRAWEAGERWRAIALYVRAVGRGFIETHPPAVR